MNILTKALTAFAFVVLFFPAGASAKYTSSTDTGADKLDFIENIRREAREKALTDEQKRLLGEMSEMETRLRKPVDPNKQPVPTAFEGEDLTYDQNTGEFVAIGKVHIVQLDGHQFDSDEEVTGNTIKQEVNIPGKAHVLQYPVLDEKASRITLDGYKTYYNYGTKMGTMENVKGKVDHEYVTGKRFEFYPNRVVIYDGTITKCSAKEPDYHESAEKIIIWPNDRMILYNAKIWLKKVVLYSKKYYEKDISPNARETEYPRVGYSKSDGAWIEQRVYKRIAKNVGLDTLLYASTKNSVKSHTELVWGMPRYYAKAAYGFYEDGDDNWIQRAPSFIYKYGDRIGKSPLSYTFDYEIGHWHKIGKERKVDSTHTYYNWGIAHDPIRLPSRYYLFLDASYSITKETYDDSTNKGFNWNMTLMKQFDDRWVAYGGYYYSHINAENALFNFDLADYAQRAEAGLSYRIDDKNRLVAGVAYDLKDNRIRDVDYYWFHDIHCSQIVVRYRAKRNSWHVSWDFLPW